MSEKPGKALAWLMFACAAFERGLDSDVAALTADKLMEAYASRFLAVGDPAPAPRKRRIRNG